MKQSEKILTIISMALIVISISIFLYNEVNSRIMLIFTIVVFITIGIVAIILFHNKTESDNPFMREVNRILKVYDAVLVNSKNLPNLNGRDIVVVSTIKDLVDAQATVRKPIYYNLVEDSCSFVLLSEKEANVFILKASENVTCPLEVVINERKNDSNAVENDHKILDQIEKTTVIKLNNQEQYKISPIREKEEPAIKPIVEPRNDQIQSYSNESQIMPIKIDEETDLPKIKE